MLRQAELSRAQQGRQCPDCLACFSLLFPLVRGDFLLLRADVSDFVDKKINMHFVSSEFRRQCLPFIFLLVLHEWQTIMSHLELNLDDHPDVIKIWIPAYFRVKESTV